MKSVKVSIQDENTLILQEDAKKGDTIDLKSLHETDIDKTSIQSVVNSIKQDKFNEELDKALKAKESEYHLKLQLQEKEIADKAKSKITEINSEITELQNRLKSAETEKELAVNKAVSATEKERDELKVKLSAEELDKERAVLALKDKYETQLKDRDDSIERLKDLKSKLSVKLIGENLEQHCQNEFNNVRCSMFPYAYFEKDNEAIEGTKGDYIYRDYESKGGVEVISIMFEMKDEQDTSENKKTIEALARIGRFIEKYGDQLNQDQKNRIVNKLKEILDKDKNLAR